jgi:hypothetical protein
VAFDRFLPYRYGFGVNVIVRSSTTSRTVACWSFSLAGRHVHQPHRGQPLYNPHIQAPLSTPPPTAYSARVPPVGRGRQIDAVRQLKAPSRLLVLVGSAYTYLQEMSRPSTKSGVPQAVGLRRNGRMV